MAERPGRSLPVAGGPSVAQRALADQGTRGSAGTTTASACCSRGPTKGGQKGELKQAEAVFLKVAELGRADGWVNLARVYQREGRIPDALAALEKAATHKKPAAPWVINWLTGQINASNGQLDEAIASFESVLTTRIPERKFDFSLDFEVINELASALYTDGAARAGQEPRAQAMAHEGDRRLPPHAGDRLRGRRRPLRPRPGLRRSGLGRAGRCEDPESPAAEAAAAVDPDELLRLAAAVADPQDRTSAPKGPSRWSSPGWSSGS